MIKICINMEKKALTIVLNELNLHKIEELNKENIDLRNRLSIVRQITNQMLDNSHNPDTGEEDETRMDVIDLMHEILRFYRPPWVLRPA